MKVYIEISNERDFDFWGGARDTIKYLSCDEIEQIFDYLEECFPDGMSDTKLNDYFWLEDDDIAENLGWPDFETLMEARSNGDWYDTYEEYQEHLDELEEQEAEEDEEDEDD